ncbi:pPIWI-associating nuclease domain-containing protein [Devosia sp. A369]
MTDGSDGPVSVSSRLIDYDIMMGLLQVYSTASRSAHIGAVVGTPHNAGWLENAMGVDFRIEERAQAHLCARELQDAGLIVPTYSDMAEPENWRIITDAGREALRRGALDELDAALGALSPAFIEMRRGAWRAAKSTLPDTQRQAAHSARELVSQVLRVVAPDDEVQAQQNYQLPKDGKVTRRDRYKLAVRKRARNSSAGDVVVLDKATDLIEAQRAKLDALAHSRDTIVAQTVHDALMTIDMVLRLLLV